MLPLLGELGRRNTTGSDAGGRSKRSGGGGSGSGAVLRERLVFINDVFFCMGDVLRLVMHDQVWTTSVKRKTACKM